MGDGKRMVGRALRNPGNTGIITLSSDLRGWKLDDAIRHEKCHLALGEWH